jgi:arylsulfatase A-like enzyme
MPEDQKPVSRRTFLKGALAAGGVLAVGGLAARLYHDVSGRDFDRARAEAQLDRIQPAQDSAGLPNIVLIFVDDLGYGDLPAYGADLIETPNLDRLAAEGVLLTQFYATAPVCTPARAGLLTGRYPIRTHLALPLYPRGHPMGAFLYVIGRYPYGVTGVPEDELLLPELLRRRGYRTGMVGKWHLGGSSPHLPTENGFESYYGPLYSNDMQPFEIYRGAQVEIPAPVDQSRLTGDYTREALAFMGAHRDEPFFLYLSHTMVHEPLHVSPEFRGKSRAGLYGDAVQELDWSVGQVLEALERLGLDEKTLLIFTSDNGPWWQGSAGGLRGRKHNVTEGGFRVPFYARWPGVLPPGGVRDGLAVNFDLLPTCLDAAGIPLPDDRVIDGVSILPLLRGEAQTPHETFYYYDGHELVAVRQGNWKYHRRHMSDNGGYPLFNHGPFLFDLESDPTESYSLIEAEPEVAQRLAQMLDDWDATINANTRGWLP